MVSILPGACSKGDSYIPTSSLAPFPLGAALGASFLTGYLGSTGGYASSWGAILIGVFIWF